MQVMLVVSSRRKAATATSQSKVEDTQLEFSESMRRTQEAVAGIGCLSRWCWRRAESQDKYAVDVLATEIDSLKRTVKEVCLSSGFNVNESMNKRTYIVGRSTVVWATRRLGERHLGDGSLRRQAVWATG